LLGFWDDFLITCTVATSTWGLNQVDLGLVP